MRGKKLDQELEKTLAQMLVDDEDINRPQLMEKLKLTSRSTLAGDRAKLIKHYEDLQSQKRGDTSNEKLSLSDKYKKLKQKNIDLTRQLNTLRKELHYIASNAHKHGYDWNKLIEPPPSIKGRD
jgi:hypothetical protein